MLPCTSRAVALSSILGLIAGYVDAICVVRYGAFAVTQTGNLIFIGMSAHAYFFPHCRSHDLSGGGGLDMDIPTDCGATAKEQVGYSLTVMASNLAGAYFYSALHHRYPKATASLAAPVLAALTLLADCIGSYHELLWEPAEADREPAGAKRRWHEGELTRWSVCLVAFSLGAVHYLSSTADGSRLKAPAFAATGHLHKIVKALWARTLGSPAFAGEAVWQSIGCVLCMALGALLGAIALHLNPFDPDPEGDAWLLVPVALIQLLVLKAHDAYLPPPGGWPEQLVEPLAGAAAPPGGPTPSGAAAPPLAVSTAK